MSQPYSVKGEKRNNPKLLWTDFNTIVLFLQEPSVPLHYTFALAVPSPVINGRKDSFHLTCNVKIGPVALSSLMRHFPLICYVANWYRFNRVQTVEPQSHPLTEKDTCGSANQETARYTLGRHCIALVITVSTLRTWPQLRSLPSWSGSLQNVESHSPDCNGSFAGAPKSPAQAQNAESQFNEARLSQQILTLHNQFLPIPSSPQRKKVISTMITINISIKNVLFH